MQVKAIDSASESYDLERPLECGNPRQTPQYNDHGIRPKTVVWASTFREDIYIIDRAREGWPSPRVVNQLRGFG